MRILTLALLLPMTFVARANYDEAVDGDLSDDQFNPTPIGLDIGSNAVTGTTIVGPDRDFFVITVGPSELVTSVRLTNYELTSNPADGGSLLAIEAGPQITAIDDPAALRGFAIVGVQAGTTVGEELLDDLGGAPLAPGTYTFWIQNTGSDTNYSLNLQFSGPRVIPTLSGWMLLLLGLLLAATGIIVTRRAAR